MNAFTTWNEALITSFQNMWAKVIAFLPELVGALVVLIIGLIIASAFGGLARRLMSYTPIDKLSERLGIAGKLRATGFKFTFSGLVGWLVKWFIIVVVLVAVADTLGLTKVSEFLGEVFLYIPNIIVAVIILGVGLVIGGVIHEVVEKSVKASRTLASASAGLLASVSKWAIIIFAVMAALTQLGVTPRLIEILLAGLVAMVALAGGLAFGLGGKEKASKWLDKLEREVSSEK